MTTEWKLVPVEPDQIHQMAFEEGQPAENGDGYLFTAEEFDLFVDRLLTSAVAPVPPAGVICDEVAPTTEQAWRSLDLPPAGDVEVLKVQYRVSAGPQTGWSFWGEGNGDEFRNSYQVEVRELVDRAHVTRLTAENARLQAELKEALHTSVKEDVFGVVCKERDALKAELAELADLKAYVTIPLRERCAQRLAMQSELTKARELLNQWLNMFEGGLKSGDLDSLWNETADYVEPTINQSAPAAKCEHILYRDGDSIGCIPESILDRNGQVALDMCTVCGKAEAELNGPCGGAPVAKGEPDA